MPHILDAQVPEASPTGAPANDYQNIATTPAMFGGLVAEGLGTFGKGVTSAGNAMMEVALERKNYTEDLHNSDVHSWFADRVTDKWQKYQSLEGKSAEQALPQFKSDVEDLRKQAMEQVPTLRAQSKLATSLRNLQDNYYRYASSHADKELRTWSAKTSSDNVDRYQGLATTAWFNGDQPSFERHLNSQDNEVRNYLEAKSFDNDTIETEVTKRRGITLKNIIEQTGTENPAAADALFEKWRDRMDEKSKLEVLSKLRGAKATMDGRAIADEETGHRLPAANPIAEVPAGFVAAVKQSEGFTPKAQWDVRQHSVGYGTRARSPDEVLTREQADERFNEEFGKAAKIVDSVNGKLDPGTRAALTSLTFNTGEAWVKAGLGDAVRAGDLAKARELFLQYNKVDGATNTGVANRRYREAQWFGSDEAPATRGPLTDKQTAYERVLARTDDNPAKQSAAMGRLNQVYSIYHEQETRAHAGFDQRLRDTTAEAMTTGSVQVPLSEADFVERYGAEKGQQGYGEYQKNIALGADMASLATMSPDEQTALMVQHAPTPGAEGFAAQAERLKALRGEIKRLDEEKKADPAAFAHKHLPVVQSAARELYNTLGGGNDMATNRRAADTFATIMDLEQARVGIPPTHRTLLPKADVERLAAQLNQPSAAGGNLAVAQQIQQMADLWGEHWPTVYRQLGEKAGPLFRVIGSGIPAAAASTLVQVQHLSAQQILKDESNEKIGPLATAVRDAMTAQFTPTTLGGGERASVIHDFESQMLKLGAYYQATGAESSASAAAKRAYKELIGDKYEFKQTFRIPKQGAPPASEIDAGARWARANLGEFGIASERDNVGGLTPEYLGRATVKAFQSDGVWATSPDEKGLVLIDPATGFAVRRQSDGGALTLSWEQLAMFGRGANQAEFGAGSRAIPTLPGTTRLMAPALDFARRRTAPAGAGPQRLYGDDGGSELTNFLGALGSRVDPASWDRMPLSRNIEDRRGEPPPQIRTGVDRTLKGDREPSKR